MCSSCDGKSFSAPGRSNVLSVGTLTIDAIGAERIDTWRSLHWTLRLVRWEVTCAFCRLRFRRSTWYIRSFVECPECGTRNVIRVGIGRTDDEDGSRVGWSGVAASLRAP